MFSLLGAVGMHAAEPRRSCSRPRHLRLNSSPSSAIKQHFPNINTLHFLRHSGDWIVDTMSCGMRRSFFPCMLSGRQVFSPAASPAFKSSSMVSSCWKQFAKWSGVSCQMNPVKQTFQDCYVCSGVLICRACGDVCSTRHQHFAKISAGGSRDVKPGSDAHRSGQVLSGHDSTVSGGLATAADAPGHVD